MAIRTGVLVVLPATVNFVRRGGKIQLQTIHSADNVKLANTSVAKGVSNVGTATPDEHRSTLIPMKK